jgi:ArsR family transcriptional regulator
LYIPAVSTAILSSDLTRTARLFHALSDETRLGILEMLRGGERCVCDLQADLDAAQSRLSFHLRVLREAGLVTDRREGRWSYYAIVPEALTEVHDAAIALRPDSSPGLARRSLPSLGRCCG